MPRAGGFQQDFEMQLRTALALQSAGRPAAAAAQLDKLLLIAPARQDALTELGILALRLGHWEQGVAFLGRSLELEPMQPTVWAIRGVGLHRLQRPREALLDLNRAIDLKADYADAYFDRGCVFRALGQQQEALADFDKAIELVPCHVEAHSNRGALLHELGSFEAALSSCERSIALNENYSQAHYNRAVVLESVGRLDEALESYERAIAKDPQNVAAQWNRATLKLLRGDFEEGWRAFEWRWQGPQKDALRQFPKPLWVGDQSLRGKVIFVHAEQGLGDFIQFCRFAATLEQLGARVLLEVPSPLFSLSAGLASKAVCVEEGAPLPHFDFHCPLMSLPLALRITPSKIPAGVPYFTLDPSKQEQWRERLGSKVAPRVGLVWSGAAGHKDDRNRSIALSRLAPLLDSAIEFHSLQPEVRPTDMEFLNRSPILRHEAHLKDFSDTAALAQQMDLVISVDTAVAHLAGALARPVWILLAYKPDFRWMLDRRDSPWYPTATLLRQSGRGDWEGVIADAKVQMRTLFGN